MHSLKKYGWIIFALIAQHIHSKELVIIAGLETPPYILPGQKSGFEIDLMRNVFTKLGHDISVINVPYGRTYDTVKQVRADIGLTLSEKSDVDTNTLTLPYVIYQNVAVSLKAKSIVLNQIQELQNFSVIAFQNASKVLGFEYAEATKISPLYLEFLEQRRQIKLLQSGKVDVVIMDINIFKFYVQSLTEANQMATMKIHKIFPPNQYKAAIRDPELRNAFNQALTEYVSSANYNRLLQKYGMTDFDIKV